MRDSIRYYNYINFMKKNQKKKESEIKKLERDLNCIYFSTSTLTKENIEDSFEMMAKLIYD